MSTREQYVLLLLFHETGPNNSDSEIKQLVPAYENSKIMCTVYELMLSLLSVGLAKAASFTGDRKHSPYPWLPRYVRNLPNLITLSSLEMREKSKQHHVCVAEASWWIYPAED